MNQKYNLTAAVDYANKKIEVSFIATGQTTSDNFEVDVISSEGHIVNRISDFTISQQLRNNTIYGSRTDLGIPLSSNGYTNTTDLSGVFAAELYSTWQFSRDVGLIYRADYISDFEVEYVKQQKIETIDTEAYIGTPVLITRGHSVPHGTVDVVSGENKITIGGVDLTSYNLSNSVIEVISGADLGRELFVTNHTSSTNILTVNENCYDLSGQLVKIKPFRHVVDYSPWSFDGPFISGGTAFIGDGGIISRFGLDKTIPNEASNVENTTIYLYGTLYSGDATPTSTTYHPLDSSETFPINLNLVEIAKSGFADKSFDLKKGDFLVFTRTGGDPSLLRTGVVMSVVASDNCYVASIWPSDYEYTIDTNELATVYRSNEFTLLDYPEFNKEYLCVLSVDNEPQATCKIQTPSVCLDITANEYESTYSSIPETAHFHVGPVYLSDGQVLSGFPLNISVTAENGDIVSPTTIINTSAHSSQNVNVGHLFSGMYFKDGVFTALTSTVFNASETIYVKAQANYGSAKINKVITLPVQPAI